MQVSPHVSQSLRRNTHRNSTRTKREITIHRRARRASRPTQHLTRSTLRRTRPRTLPRRGTQLLPARALTLPAATLLPARALSAAPAAVASIIVGIDTNVRCIVCGSMSFSCAKRLEGRIGNMGRCGCGRERRSLMPSCGSWSGTRRGSQCCRRRCWRGF